MLQTLTQRIVPFVVTQFSRRALPNFPTIFTNLQSKSLPRSFLPHFQTFSFLRSTLPSTQPLGTPHETLLRPITPLVAQVAGFKVKGRLRRRCKDCYFVIRQERLYVICKTHPRHKQMAMKARDYKSWILTHATQSKIRPY